MRWRIQLLWSESRPRKVAACLSVGLAALILISCATLNRVVVAPPQIPGAKFIGSESCAQCHENITRDFRTASHARLKAEGPNASEIGCESCHGPGSIHSESGGARNTIINPRRNPDACFQCHLDKRGEFQLGSHHPVIEGRISCSDCHNSHKGDAIHGGTSLLTERDTCGKCHIAQRGPFVFEHEAVREGCTICHNPHGTVNAKLLTQRNQNLCLRCHFQQQAVTGQLALGGIDHSQFVSKGTCWTAGCHEAVHGSQIGSSLRY